MEIALSIAQGVLGAMMIMAGIMKSLQSKEKLAPKLPWVKDFSATTVKFVGVSELLGGIGLIVPWYTGILPVLTPIAAVGIGIIMVLAAVYHFQHEEYRGIGINMFLVAIAAFIAYGRFQLLPS
jgi:uncharacterized membrane protein